MSGPRRLLATRVPARPESLRSLRAELRAALAAAGYEDPLAAHVILAVNEAGMNIIQHAYGGDPAGEITLEITDNDGMLVVRLRDSAPPVDRASIRPRPLGDLRPGGLGTHFIRTLMDEVDYARTADGRGNELTMKKRCTPARREGGR